MPSFASGQSELAERKTYIVGKLRNKWRCTKHLKDRDTCIYCYSSNKDVCYPLTHGNLSFWALDIVCLVWLCYLSKYNSANLVLCYGKIEGKAKIEEKPVTLYLHTARPPSQSSTPHPSDQMGFSGSFMPFGMYRYPPGSVAMPMWGYLGHGSGGIPQPGQYFGMPMLMMKPMSTSSNFTASGTAFITIPDVVAWFSYIS